MGMLHMRVGSSFMKHIRGFKKYQGYAPGNRCIFFAIKKGADDLLL